jgi:Retrotransposon gag protein
MSSGNPNPVCCTIDAGLWNEIISFVANHPVEPPHNESVTTYQQIYRVSRHLLGRLEDSHVTSNILGMHELQQEVALAHVARQEQADLVNFLQLRLNETQSALVRAVGSSTPRREKIPDPPKYSGDRAGLRPFLTHLLLKLSRDHDLFPDEQKKMAYAIGRLEGSAFNHLLPYVQPTGVSLESVESLVEVLETAFGDPDRVGSAERALENLRQNNRDFATYYAEFSRLIADVDWKSDPAIRHALKRGLSLELRQELVHHDIPESLTGFVRLCQKLDNRLRAFEAEQRPRPSSRPTPRHTPVLARTQAPFPVSIPSHAAQSATSSIYRGPAPTDLSSNRRKLSPEERARRIAEGLCLYCGGAGHMASVCPNSRPRTGAPLRALEGHISLPAEND